MRVLFVVATILCLAIAEDGGVFEEIFEDVSSRSLGCFVNINRDLATPQPIYIRPGTEDFFHPLNRRGIIEMSAGQEMELFCTNEFATPSGVSSNLIRISCVSDTQFRHNGTLHHINEFTCRNWPTSVAQRRLTITRCFNKGIFVDVGFQVNDRFLLVYSACHDPVTEENYYTKDKLTPASDGQESNVARPSWRQGDFFPGKNVDNLHMRNVQRDTIAATLGSTEIAAEIIEEPNSNIFLARGHMAAMTDFISANEQRSTFFFVNTAPQFQTFNSMNWVAVEMSTRRLAADRNIVLDVYTGTFGRAMFKDVFGIDRAIFLDHTNQQIPVPILYYKIIVNRADRTGAVFLGVNNPHLSLSQIKRDFVICNDVSDRIDYMSWRREDLRRGYGYACEVNDFLRRVPHVQGIDVVSLLV